MSNWLYNNTVFEDKDIPEGAVGFVYMMTAIIDGHTWSYIGKKNFYSNRKKALKKKDIPTDKRKKTYKIVSKTDYQNYYSSNDVLKKAHKEGVIIKRVILKICYSATELTYQEVKHQFVYGVLETEGWLNGNILGKFYKQNK